MKILDLFAGVGVAVGAREAGVEELGVEMNPDANQTREINGFTTVYENVWDFELAQGLEVDGVWASPPCQTFSTALPAASSVTAAPKHELVNAIADRVWETPSGLREAEHDFGDPRSSLVLTPLTYAKTIRPKFLVLEQVPGVLRLWEAFKPHLESFGYNVWTGYLNSEEYGVPQSRKRAYLVATQQGDPTPYNPKTKPVTMEQALGWGITDRPAPTITSKVGVTNSASGTQAVYEKAILRGAFKFKPGGDPSPSKVAKSGIAARYAPGLINATVEDNKVLQSFPRDMEFFGNTSSQQLQIGNAVPPLVAKHLLEGLTRDQTRTIV